MPCSEEACPDVHHLTDESVCAMGQRIAFGGEQGKPNSQKSIWTMGTQVTVVPIKQGFF